jgi:hypothetical protein
MEELDPSGQAWPAFGNIVVTCIPTNCRKWATIAKKAEYLAGGGQNTIPGP